MLGKMPTDEVKLTKKLHDYDERLGKRARGLVFALETAPLRSEEQGSSIVKRDCSTKASDVG